VGSGGYLWGASRRLVRYIEAYGDGSPALPSKGGDADLSAAAVASRPLGGLTLLELGSGTGGMGLAAAVLGVNVTLSDQDSYIYPGGLQRKQPTHTLLDLARENVRQNAPMLTKCAHYNAIAAADAATSAADAPQISGADISHVTSAPSRAPSRLPSGPVPLPVVARLLWGDADDHAALPHAKYDIIAGADVLLFTSAHEDLLRTLRTLSTVSTVVLLEHTDRGNETDEYPCDMLHFLQLVDAEGLWKPTVVRDLGRHITIRMVFA